VIRTLGVSPSALTIRLSFKTVVDEKGLIVDDFVGGGVSEIDEIFSKGRQKRRFQNIATP